MKISVFRIDWYTVTKNAVGGEVSRTSPQRTVLASPSLDEAVSGLPKPSNPNTFNVLAQSHVLYSNIPLVAHESITSEPIKPERQAKVTEPKGG